MITIGIKAQKKGITALTYAGEEGSGPMSEELAGFQKHAIYLSQSGKTQGHPQLVLAGKSAKP